MVDDRARTEPTRAAASAPAAEGATVAGARPAVASARRPDHDELRIRGERLDAEDPLAGYRNRFVITDPDTVYLDGNSLGRLPVSTRDRLREVIDVEWGTELIRGWSRWIELGRRTGDVIAGLIGAEHGEVTLSDSTSVNLYKLAAAALDARPGRRAVLTDDDNFPTDQYLLQGLAEAGDLDLRVLHSDPDRGVRADDVGAALDADVALVCLSHVAYRSGAVADLAGITMAAHEAGALVLWDLSHSAGSVPVGLSEAGVDLATGCTYKHLNGGPGAPAFLYVRRDLQPVLRQPIWGWFGQADQFDMAGRYQPADGIDRFLVGTPPVLSGYAALEGARLSAEAGIEAIAAKARALTGYLIELADARLAPLGFRLASPREDAARGAHVTLYHPQAWQICQALIQERVIPDFRTPDRLRLGVAPLYTSFGELYVAVSRLRDIVAAGRHEAFPTQRSRVT
ncbi:kynureninase [Rugosimonospora africana]|uniref:Kynureninase n=1 Tax=Rugosimonospora africana TaxID=556532 RepID=A0A8J3R1S0_9ACTN|nr:kynureninase [Rugosimonospora africana]GIH20242.1 kynureninase [Rugosimonospora africana]